MTTVHDKQRLLYLITHAQTEQQPQLDARQWTLTAQGEAQAEALAEQAFWSSVTDIWVSSEAKTVLTVQPLLDRRALPLHRNARFDELHRGGWVGDYAARVRQAFERPHECISDWESADSARQRILAGIQQIRRQNRQGATALVGHGLTLSLYRAHLLGQSKVSFDDWRSLSFAAVACVDLNNEELLADFSPVGEPIPRA